MDSKYEALMTDDMLAAKLSKTHHVKGDNQMQRNIPARDRILLGLVTIGIFANTDSSAAARQAQLAKETEKALKSEAAAKQKHHNQPKHVQSHAPQHKHRQTGARLKRY